MIIPLEEASNYPFQLVGGKGFQLGRLFQIEVNVPKGFILSTKYYKADWELIKEEVYSTFDKYIDNSAAVRSSGNIEDSKKHSFAGLLHSELNVKREGLEDCINAVWNSKESDRVKKYLINAELDFNTLSVAVIVQQMIKGQFSGVFFSSNPVTQNSEQAVVEVVEGSGDKLVSGVLTPNTYYLEKKSNGESHSVISARFLGENSNVTDFFTEDVAKELLRISELIESEWKCPVDIEWVWSEGRLFIVQARPITTI